MTDNLRTDEELGRECWAAYGRSPGSHIEGLRALGARARTILATQPDRYAQGFERAREMAVFIAETVYGSDGLAIAKAIRNMEMPDE